MQKCDIVYLYICAICEKSSFLSLIQNSTKTDGLGWGQLYNPKAYVFDKFGMRLKNLLRVKVNYDMML